MHTDRPQQVLACLAAAAKLSRYYGGDKDTPLYNRELTVDLDAGHGLVRDCVSLFGHAWTPDRRRGLLRCNTLYNQSRL